ncbi:transporter [Siminovitchia terrae]|uniref:Transporter n=1 Tax=Siminovitchia terrae TaxID=1914933 RepID=A0ABQ4KY26_SIMTE|nr:oligosaccharide flippase family protein [Siminovitchia terrae]GIN96861.1 transporter [Siminovitchia terrae]
MSNRQSKKTVLLENTIMLYILVFSSYLLSFITVPYQTRILGPDYYGRVGFALAFMIYFQLLIDFGFILSATEDVAKNRENKEELSKIVTSVNIIKTILFFICLLILIILCVNIPRFKEDSLLYILTFLSVATASFLPDFLYRGLENMKIITVRTILIRIFFVLMIFLFLKDKEDYLLIPLFTMLGNLGAIVGVYVHAIKVVKIKFIRINTKYIWHTFKKSSYFFYSRIASTAYTATNTFALGLMNSIGSNVVGLYTSADKLINTAKNGFSPIADSLFPYMVKNRDFKLVKKVLLILMPPVVIGSILIGIFANNFCAFLLGEEFRSAGNILRLLMPIVVMTPLVYILGFPVLTPMGLSKHANLSVIVSSVFHILGLSVLIIAGIFNVVTLCYITVITQFIVLLYRGTVVWVNRKLITNKI